MALATANIPDSNALKIMENLPHSTMLSPLTPHSTSCANTLLSPSVTNPHLIRYMKCASPGPAKLASPIAGAIIGGTTTTTVGGQQLRLVHLVVNASSARSIAKSLREGKPIEAIPDGYERTSVTPVRSSATINLAPTLQSSALSSSSSPSSPAIAPSPAASSCSDADSASSLALSSSSLHSSSSQISPENPSTCTICGNQYTERTEFNAHIRAHLKEKLHNRRNKEQSLIHNKSASNPELLSIKTEELTNTSDSNLLKLKSPMILSSTHQKGIDLQQSHHLGTIPDHSILQQQLSIKTTQPGSVHLQIPIPNHGFPQSSPSVGLSNIQRLHEMDQTKIRPIPNSLLPSAPVPLSSSVLSSNIATAITTARNNNIMYQSQQIISAASLPASASPLFYKPNNLSITPVASGNKLNKPDLGALLQHVQQANQNKPVVISPNVMAELAACKPVPVSLPSLSSPSTTSLLLLKDNREVTSNSQSLVQLVPTLPKVLSNSNVSSNNSICGLAVTQSSQIRHTINSVSSSLNGTTAIKVPSHSIIGLPKYPNANLHLNSSSITSTIASSTTVPAPYVFTDSNGVSTGVLPPRVIHQNQTIQDIIASGILHRTNEIPSSLISKAILRKTSHSNPVVTTSSQQPLGINANSIVASNQLMMGEKEKREIKAKSSGKKMDPMAYEMELNRIDFRNDVSSILDQIEKDFEINSVANMGTSFGSVPGHIDLNSLHLETPPDSDSETNPQNMTFNSDKHALNDIERNPASLKNENIHGSLAESTVGSNAVLAFDRLTKRIRLNELEDLELMDTSKSEIDQLLGENQLCTSEVQVSDETVTKQILTLEPLSKTKRKLLSLSQLKSSAGQNLLHSGKDYTKLKEDSFVTESEKANFTNIQGSSVASSGREEISNSQSINNFSSKTSLLFSKSVKRKLLQCQFCPSTFAQIDDFKSHVNLQHKTNTYSPSSLSNTTKIGKKERTTANKNFICNLCDKGFVQKSHLTRHMKIHGIDKKNGIIESSNSNNGLLNVQEQFICRICSKNCKNKVGLVRHRAKHLACVQCSEVFNNKVSLQEHLLKVHTKNALISIEQPMPSPSPPSPLLDSPTESISSLLFHEQNDVMNESLFSCNARNIQGKGLIPGTTITGPKDERLSIVVSPNGVSNMKDTISNNIDTTFLPEDIMSESFADISSADYLESCTDQGLSDEFYPTDLF